MSNKPKYYIVEASALPEVFLKVAEAERLLSTGEASTVNEATRMTDISRSAFYKYRDSVLPFQNMMTGRIITFQLLLHDEPGLLSNVLDVFADHKANIITINSIVPTNGTAVVTISAETMDLTVQLEELLRQPIDDKVAEIKQQREVVKEALRGSAVVKKIYPSDANFLLVEVADADAMYDFLIGRGIIVRNRNKVKGCEGCLRLTIGKPEENEALLKTISEYEKSVVR